MRRRRVAAAALPGLDTYRLPDLLGLLSGWAPPGHALRHPRHDACRWQTWEQYLADARRLRADLRAKFRSGARAGLRPTFAECVVAFVGQHGTKALPGATYAEVRAALPETPE